MVFGESLSQRSESHRWRADGVGVEKTQDSQRCTSSKIQKYMKDSQCEPKQFNDRIIFMSMCNDIVCGEQGTQKSVNIVHLQLRIMLADFRAVVGHSWDLDQKRNGTELL